MSQENKQNALALRQAAETLTINTHQEYENAASQILKVRSFRKNFIEPLRKAAWSSYQTMLDQIKEEDAPAKYAEETIQAKMLAWNDLQEKLRAQEQARLQEEARKKEVERRLAEAVELEKVGRKEESVQVLDTPQVTAPVVLPKAPKVAGISFPKTWTFRVVDLTKLPDDWKIADEVRLGKYAKAMGATAKVPGVEFYQVTTMAKRG